jgi:hypothetical protein
LPLFFETDYAYFFDKIVQQSVTILFATIYRHLRRGNFRVSCRISYLVCEGLTKDLTSGGGKICEETTDGSGNFKTDVLFCRD